MNRKILAKFITLLLVATMLAIFAAPVLAVERVPVKFAPKNVVTTGGTTNITPSGILHVTNAVRTATVDLKIGSDLYVGSIEVDLDYTVNPLQGKISNHYHKITMTFPVQNDITEVGTLEGVLTWTADLGSTPGTIDPTSLVLHGVLQGSGAFEGYKLHLIYEPADPLFVDNSYALIK